MKETIHYQQLKAHNERLKKQLQERKQCYFNPIGLLVPAIGITIGIIIQFI